MKMQTSADKRRVQRSASRRAAGSETMNLPRMFLFLELFVEKDIPGRSNK
jgi:hypothetical protein